MSSMNSPRAIARIKKGFFRTVFRGFGSRKADRIGQDELRGFHYLIDTDCQSHGLRALIQENEKAGKSRKAALREGKKQHFEFLRDTFSNPESLKNLYENYQGKGQALKKAGLVDPESDLIFTTPKLSLACFYGPIVMVIEESVPRGLDVNSIARDSKYYTIARFLKNLGDLQIRSILSDYVADRDEYVLPSYVPPVDVTGLIVHAPSPIIIANRIVIPPPPVRRVYRKFFKNNALTIDVYDGHDKLIARLSTSISAPQIEPSIKRSSENLPEEIAAAWKAFVERQGRASGRRH